MEMEIGNQIRRYRAELGISQEELSEKIYVTRQTVSNWENAKSYPDIHSLLLMSGIFGVSLDDLIKGDIEKMREEISKDSIANFNFWGALFGIMYVLMIIALVPLVLLLGAKGLVIEGILALTALAVSIKVEKLKKKYNIQTFKEISAFCEGKPLDEISRQREIGKRPYQSILLTLGSATLGFILSRILFLFS